MASIRSGLSCAELPGRQLNQSMANLKETHSDYDYNRCYFDWFNKKSLAHPLNLLICQLIIFPSINYPLSLGIISNLLWYIEMDKITRKIDSWIGVIKGIRLFVPPATLRCICNVFVQPLFNYCVVVWGSCVETLSDNLHKL